MVLGLSLREVVEAVPWVWADRPNEKVLARTRTAIGVGLYQLESLDGEVQEIQDVHQGMNCLDRDQDGDQSRANRLADASK